MRVRFSDRLDASRLDAACGLLRVRPQPANLLLISAGPAFFGCRFSGIGFDGVCVCVCHRVRACVCVNIRILAAIPELLAVVRSIFDIFIHIFSPARSIPSDGVVYLPPNSG